MEAITKVNTKRGRSMEKGASHGLIALLTRVIGNSTKCMAMVSSDYPMGALTLESTSMIENMVEESSPIQMGDRRKATGKTVSRSSLLQGLVQLIRNSKTQCKRASASHPFEVAILSIRAIRCKEV